MLPLRAPEVPANRSRGARLRNALAVSVCLAALASAGLAGCTAGAAQSDSGVRLGPSSSSPATASGSTSAAAHSSAVLPPANEQPALFAHTAVAYGIHPFTAEELAQVQAALPGRVVPVYGGEVALDSDNAKFPTVPVQTFTVDPAAYAAIAGRPELAKDLSHGVVLSEMGAKLRHAKAGDVLTLATGATVTVSAVVDDHWIAGFEMAGSPAILGDATSADGPSYLLLDDQGDLAATSAAVTAALGPDKRVRVMDHTINGFMSSADSTLTQAQIKLAMGEFDVRPAAGKATAFIPDTTWTSAYIVTRKVPQLGNVTCNKSMIGDLTAAMQQVTDAGLGSLIDTKDYHLEGGCWNPRNIRFGGGEISRHSWGAAVDINVKNNPLGAVPKQDPRLIAIMESHHFVWGGRWLRPDGAHFEWVGSLADQLPPLTASTASSG